MTTPPDGSDEVRRLFEEHVPEVASGIVEIKSIARERGRRSMLAVCTADERIDPIGVCVGLRGARVKCVVQQLRDEIVDIIRWSESPKVLICNALAPVVVREIILREDRHHATVKVDMNRSEGPALDPVKLILASRVTGWGLNVIHV